MKTSYKVLLIDDDLKVCDLIAAFIKLGAKSVDLVIAHDTTQGLFKLENESFDLVVVDKNLPGKSGLEFITLLRKSFKFARQPLILLSGSLNNSDVLFSVENKVNDIIVKPFKYAQFLEKLKKVLSKIQ